MGTGEGSLPAGEAETLIQQFQFQRLLNQDQGGRRIVLLGYISSKPALLLVERAPFSSNIPHLSSLATSLSSLTNLSNNDIYFWYMASTKSRTEDKSQPDNLKINLIFPCTEKHVKKYSQQGLRWVVETPQIYKDHVRPYMQKQRDAGRLDWIFNIIQGRAEQEDILYREHGEEGFLVSPDLNWDRKTMTSLHLLALVERRDIWSLRDLTPNHVTWLKHMRQKIMNAATKVYPELDQDQLKLYVHYQPTYYHFHIHIVHVMLEAGRTQAVGKAFGLDNLIGQLETMAEGKSMADMSISYDIGEASEIWTEIYQPLKEAK
ncbi:scavenger mRNA decapping enzyme [Venturia nashicola]|uniref:Scavenger mRNA decapping enzyme n=1 Tax=Venturia nashicola TaxID=86259 RepID=A0A4Z1PBU6_9PEZI|nr:scavenger mRNA decapping enzyme [Venturia nashicola]